MQILACHIYWICWSCWLINQCTGQSWVYMNDRIMVGFVGQLTLCIASQEDSLVWHLGPRLSQQSIKMLCRNGWWLKRWLNRYRSASMFPGFKLISSANLSMSIPQISNKHQTNPIGIFQNFQKSDQILEFPSYALLNNQPHHTEVGQPTLQETWWRVKSRSMKVTSSIIFPDFLLLSNFKFLISHQSTNRPTKQSINWSVHRSINQSTNN